MPDPFSFQLVIYPNTPATTCPSINVTKRYIELR